VTALTDPGTVTMINPNKVMVDALSVIIERDPALSLLGAGTDAEDAILFSRAFKPRVLVLADDVSGAPLSLLIALIRQFAPTTRVLITTGSASGAPDDLLSNRSVWGVIPLEKGMPELLAAIRCVAHATRRPPVKSSHRSHHAARLAAPARPATGLSARELQVLELLAEGDSNAGIAIELSISIGTVKRHVANIYAKLGVNTRVAAVRRGASLGLLELGASGWADIQELA